MGKSPLKKNKVETFKNVGGLFRVRTSEHEHCSSFDEILMQQHRAARDSVETLAVHRRIPTVVSRHYPRYSNLYQYM